MKEIGKTLTKILFYFVAAVLLVWTASLTVHFIASALPSMPWYVPYLALVVFDGGMIAWMFVFLKYAEGTIQRAVALGLVMFDFAGVALLVMADILLGGQTWTTAPEGLGTWAVWGIGIWTVVNVLGVLAFHIGDPQAQIQMSIQNEKDQIFRGALDNLGARRAENSKMLSNELGSRMYTQMLDELLVDNDRNGVPDALEGSYQVPAQAGIPAQPVTTYVNGTVATHTAAQTRPAPATLASYSVEFSKAGKWTLAGSHSNLEDAKRAALRVSDETWEQVKVIAPNGAVVYEIAATSATIETERTPQNQNSRSNANGSDFPLR